MAPTKPSKPASAPKPAGKKEKVFHPQSRKAGQLVRTQHRKSRLVDLARERSKKQGSQVNVYSFFYHALPPEGVLTLEELHGIINDVWLARHDQELEAERAARRKGRPKSVKEQKLEDTKLREAEDYRSGIDVIDLTHPTNVALLRSWDQNEAAYIEQLRFIRVSSTSPETFVVSRSGRHPLLVKENAAAQIANQEPVVSSSMDLDEVPLLLEPHPDLPPLSH